MIWESAYWKQDLLRASVELRRRIVQTRWPEVSLAKLEQRLMLGFYSIRKLIEARKLSDAIVASQLELQQFAIRPAAKVTLLNWHRVDEHYAIETPEDCIRKLEFVCNQFIHSYLFFPVHSEDGGLDGVWLASDRERSKRLYGIRMARIADLFEAVGNDYPSSAVFVWGDKRGDYDVTGD